MSKKLTPLQEAMAEHYNEKRRLVFREYYKTFILNRPHNADAEALARQAAYALEEEEARFGEVK